MQISDRTRRVVKRALIIAACRVACLITGWQLSLRFADWRQLVAYPILFAGAVPDAVWLRLIVAPRSAAWPWAMCVSIAMSSAVIAWASVRRAAP